MSGASKEVLSKRKIMPLVSRAFAPGKAREIIEAIEDPEEREMAWAEYCQYTGRAEEAVSRARPFLTHEDLNLRFSAHIVCFISGLAIGDADGARQALLNLESIEKEEHVPVSGAYCANVIKIMLFLKETEFSVDDRIQDALPEGAKFFVCYFLALREYLRDEYEKVVGMAQAALMMGGGDYPIAAIYLHLISAASMVRIKKIQEAERHFQLAWEITEADKLIAPFGMQYIMLAGLNKKSIKKNNPKEYRAISRYADEFIPAWIAAHNGLVDWHEDHGLTKTEHIAAMLFRKGLSAREIASCMSISVNTVKRHIAASYQKMSTKSREEFPKNIIR